jgi:hypothetical protein
LISLSISDDKGVLRLSRILSDEFDRVVGDDVFFLKIADVMNGQVYVAFLPWHIYNPMGMTDFLESDGIGVLGDFERDKRCDFCEAVSRCRRS